MKGMPLAKTAIFPDIELIWLRFFVFRCSIISPLTLCTGKGDYYAHLVPPLFHNIGDDPCSYGAAALPDGKPQFLLQGDGGDQLHLYAHIVPRHHHLNPLR
jgi:hypothetical protein